MSKPSAHAPDILRCIMDWDLRLLPGQPSAAQCAAGARAGGVSPTVARLIYLAMLEADERSS